MSDSQLCFMTAVEQRRKLHSREVSARELVTAHLEQIERVNPKVNAICTLDGEGALAQAAAADDARRRGFSLGPLHGLPIAIKDLLATKGMRTTYGSPIFADNVPDTDDLLVEKLKGAGAIVVGKTNTPEFGAGSQTFNGVFGATHNPYDTSKTCGGSSGGAAVALACGMLPIADGSDLGGSLRNPASFCNVVGLRPSPGRVAAYPRMLGWDTLTVLGPMARTARDVALLLSAMAGPDARDPMALPEPGGVFRDPLERNFGNVRIAFSEDLGQYPVERVVRDTVREQMKAFEALGCVVDEAHPDFSGADETFHVLRSWRFATRYGSLLEKHRAQMKDTVVWNIEDGFKVDGMQVARAEVFRTELYHRVRQFLERYEFLVLPTSQVVPFPVEQPYVTEIEGKRLQTYVDWMGLCYAITLTGHPAVSVPCGFTPDGLPVGLQIVGRHHQDFSVLQLAHAFEQATGFGRTRPSLAQ